MNTTTKQDENYLTTTTNERSKEMKHYNTTSNESVKADYVYILNEEDTARSASDEFISEMEDLLFSHSRNEDGKVAIDVYSEDDKTLWMDMMAASVTSNIKEVNPSARKILEDLVHTGSIKSSHIEKYAYFERGVRLLGPVIRRTRKYSNDGPGKPRRLSFSWTMRKTRKGTYLELRLGANKVVRFFDVCWEIPQGLESSAA